MKLGAISGTSRRSSIRRVDGRDDAMEMGLRGCEKRLACARKQGVGVALPSLPARASFFSSFSEAERRHVLYRPTLACKSRPADSIPSVSWNYVTLQTEIDSGLSQSMKASFVTSAVQPPTVDVQGAGSMPYGSAGSCLFYKLASGFYRLINGCQNNEQIEKFIGPARHCAMHGLLPFSIMHPINMVLVTWLGS
jgi:hypothetical protein